MDDEDIEIHSVSHLTIQYQSETVACSSHFPNVTKLTLICNYLGSNGPFISDVGRIVPLTQLKSLVIDEQDICISQLIEILSFSPNIHSLKFSSMFFLDFHPLSIEQTEMVRQISMKNKITELTLGYRCTLEHLHFFVDLCPRLQRLTIGIHETLFESILKFLLPNKALNLFLLSLLYTNDEAMKKIQTIINCEKLLENYSIELVNKEIHLWW